MEGFLLFIENIFVSLVFGASTIAVMSYFICTKHKYQEGLGAVLIQSIYRVLRVCHIALITIILFDLFVFVVLDGDTSYLVIYLIKLLILSVQALIAYSMHIKQLSVGRGAALIAAGWYFLASFHAYVLILSKEFNLIYVILVYILYIALAYLVFYIFRWLINHKKI